MNNRPGLIPRLLFLCLFNAILLTTACGDYKPCEVLARRICTDCPSVSDEWEAACLCIEFDTLKENGYKCAEASEADNIRCNATLEQWDESLCEELN
jgi:hypothetical protein